MEKQTNTVPIQKLAKAFGIIAAVGAVAGLAYYFNAEQYVAGLVSLFSGLSVFAALMTLAKIADNLDELKKANAEK